MSTRALVSVLLIALGSHTLAQQPPATQKPAPQEPSVTFRVEVNYVEIDAIVTDAQGNIVRNLTKDDFEVLEDGKPQTLSLLSLVDIPVERPDAPLFSPTTIPPDVRSNVPEFNGRVFVLVLDDRHTHFARSARVKLAAKQFIERYLGENDMAAIVQTGGQKGSSQEFTSDRRSLLRAVDRFMGQKVRSATLDKIDDYYLQRNMQSGSAPRDLNEAERASKARNTMSTLESVANYLAGIRGRRKAVLFFSEGIDYDIINAVQNRYATDIRDEMQQAIAAATRGNVSFYGIDPRGLGGNSDESIEIGALPDDPTLGLGPGSLNEELRRSHDSLRYVSDETGGFAAVNRNDLREAFGKILAENSSYYLLGYYSNDTRRDGRFRKLQVRVKRPGVSVRARRGYAAPKGRQPAASSANKSTSVALREVLDSPLPVSGLSLNAFAASMKGSSPNASVALTLEVGGKNLKFSEENGLFLNNLEMSVIAVDEGGKIRDGGHDVVQLKLRPQTRAIVSSTGVRIAHRLELAPGKYRLRIGARESGAGAVGSVLYDLEVPDFAKSDLSMSSIFLASAASTQIPSVNPDPELKGVLPGPPVAIRDFPRTDTLALFAEVYDQNKPAHRVVIKSSVIADDGKVVFNDTEERRSDELQGGKGGFGYVKTFDVKNFSPGRYVLRVEALTTLKNGGGATRELEFRVR
jgi:VWFA-related protein